MASLPRIDYDAPDAFRRALQRLQDQSARSGRSVAVFVDEAEVLFGSRASMQDYHSVLVAWAMNTNNGGIGGGGGSCGERWRIPTKTWDWYNDDYIHYTLYIVYKKELIV